MGSEVFLGAAAGIRALDEKLVVGPEIWFTTVVEDSNAFFKRRTTPFEVLLGGHYAFHPDWRAGAGVGPGLTRAFGSPQVRFVLSVEYAAAFRQAPAPSPPSDRDNDGILDAEDACPDVPGVRTDDPKTNGCPPPPSDRDKDGIVDSDDACPDIPGEKTDDPKTNGCPPARIEQDEIKISKQVQFKFDSDEILPES